jgi:hypothetical protein
MTTRAAPANCLSIDRSRASIAFSSSSTPTTDSPGTVRRSPAWRAAEELLDEPALKRLDEEMERGTQELIVAMRHVTDVNMREYVTRFATALAADAIVPADF